MKKNGNNKKAKVNYYNKARICNLYGECGKEYNEKNELYLVTLFGLHCLNTNK